MAEVQEIETVGAEALDIAALRRYCALTHGELDSVIVDAALAAIAACEAHVERVYLRQRLAFTLGAFPAGGAAIMLPRRWALSAPAPTLTYVTQGLSAVLDPGAYRLLGDRIETVDAAAWPPADPVYEAVRVEYSAGAHTRLVDAPRQFQRAVLLLTRAWVDNREAVAPVVLRAMPYGVEWALGQLRERGV